MYFLKRFFVGFSITFVFLTLTGISLIPYDYPSEPFWVVWYQQVVDQLFWFKKIIFYFPLSIIVGTVFGLIPLAFRNKGRLVWLLLIIAVTILILFLIRFDIIEILTFAGQSNLK